MTKGRGKEQEKRHQKEKERETNGLRALGAGASSVSLHNAGLEGA